MEYGAEAYTFITLWETHSSKVYTVWDARSCRTPIYVNPMSTGFTNSNLNGFKRQYTLGIYFFSMPEGVR